MAGETGNTTRSTQRRNGWRIAAWSTAALLLLLPLVAMQLTDGVRWGPGDFAFAAALLFGTLGTFELVTRASPHVAYRAGVGVALAAACGIVWINAAVGVIGSEDNPANLLFGGVLLVALGGATLARLRAAAMVPALVATAVAQAAVAVVAVAVGGPKAFVLTVVFVGLWLLSAGLFRRAAREAVATV